MDDKQEQFVDELNKSIISHNSQYKLLTVIQWFVMIPVAIAGAVTTIAGSPQGENQWFAESNALVVWGVITSTGTLINQIFNPGKRAEHHLKAKLALKAIRGAIQYRGLPIAEADQLRTTAWINPEEAVEELNQWHTPQVT